MTALTIYVAGGSDERDLVAGLLAQLRAAGWTVTYDWPAEPPAMRGTMESALADVRGIAAARVLWYVAPPSKSEGSHFELGLAYALRELRLGREIVASGPVGERGRIFPMLADRTFSHHEDALEHLLDVARAAAPVAP